MFRRLIVPALLFTLFLASAAAQEGAAGRIVEVRVDGTTTYADIDRTIITTRVGVAPAGVHLEAERNRVYSLDTCASVSAERESAASATILVERVTQNTLVEAVKFEGVASTHTTEPPATLASTHLLEAARVYNTIS